MALDKPVCKSLFKSPSAIVMATPVKVEIGRVIVLVAHQIKKLPRAITRPMIRTKMRSDKYTDRDWR